MSGQTVLHVVEQVWCGKSKGGGHESGGSGRDCRQRNGGGQPVLVTGGSKGGEAARFLAEEAVGRMGLSKQVRKVEAQRGVKGAGEQHVGGIFNAVVAVGADSLLSGAPRPAAGFLGFRDNYSQPVIMCFLPNHIDFSHHSFPHIHPQYQPINGWCNGPH